MDIRTKIYSTLSIIATMTAVMACSEIDNVANNHYRGDGLISFSASTAAVDEGTMRAAEAKTQKLTSIAAQTDDGITLYLHTTVTPIPVDTATTTRRGAKTESVANISNFGVKAYKTTNAFATDLTTSGTQHFDNIDATTTDGTPTTSSEWNTSTSYYWPDGTDKLSFFAYSPYNSTNPFSTSAGRVTLSYTANATVASQQDLLIAAAFDENHSSSLDPKQALTFKHALTAVTFTAAADLFPCTITKVSLAGIPTTNTYTYATATGSSYGTWGTTGSDTQTFNFTLSQAVSGSATTLTSGTNTLLMVPQTLPSGATATIEFTDAASRSHKLSYSLSGQVWEAGKQVNYTLSSSSLTSISINFADAYAQQSGSSAQTLPSEIKTAFAASDQIGFYVVDIVNDVMLATNVPITVSSAGASVTITSLNSSTLAAQAFLSDDTNKYRYFAYYPYQSTAPTTIAASAVTTSTTGEQFFASLISGWTPVADQSAASAATINSYDLQVGDVIGTGSGISSKALTIKLRHQMGLAAIAMASSGTSSHTETLTLDGNTTTQKYVSSSTTAYYALDEFSGNLPYKVGTRNTPALRCYFLVNPAKSYTFGTTYKYADADAQRQWNNFTVSSSSNTVNAGKYLVITTTTPKFKNLGRLYSYSATVIPQTFTPAFSSLYQFQCWGGAGGRSLDQGKMGANLHSVGGYVTGDMELTANERTFYLAVGSQGGDAIYRGYATGGWPGGGKGYCDQADDESGGGGGGFSAVYLETFTSSTATNFDKLKTRIMVAGAGGGSTYSTYYSGGFLGAGGGLEGLASTSAAAGTQNSGYQFGIGQDAKSNGPGDYGSGGGGGGYWGGCALQTNTTYSGGATGAYNGGGGSSFASGMTGCKAITSTSTSSSISYRTGSDATIHYSGVKFTNASTIAGNASMPNPAAGTGNVTGNPTNGYIRITCKPYGN